MKAIIILCILYFNALALNFKVVSYNVENLFDLKYDSTEYTEYIPNSKSNWNKSTLELKLNNIFKVINDMDADIIVLQEIESLKALKLLQNKIPQYKYIKFYKKPTSAIGLGFLSKYKIIDTNIIKINRFDKHSRPALDAIFQIKDKPFHIINTHWSSKRKAESSRIKYAQAIYNYVKNLEDEYIIVGDLNSNYNEFKTFRFNDKLNDTDGVTGINQVLNTTINQNFISKDDIFEYKRRVHFNAWLELNQGERFSYKFRKRNNTPDNIILSPYLFDNTDIEYKNNSFKVFKPSYLYKDGKINRWQMKGKDRIHTGIGFSDHLPIMATFYLSDNKSKKPIKNINTKNKISDLYKLDTIKNNYKINNAIVIYKYKNNAIIKQKNDRAIYLFNCAKDLKLDGIYDLKVSKLDDFYGLKEIKEVNDFTLKEFVNTSSFYMDANKIDILNPKYQNEIITNLKGYFKDGYLNFKDKKIKLYSKDKKLLPKNGQFVTIRIAHLATFKNKAQIVIYKKDDIIND